VKIKLKIEQRPVDSLVAYALNARTHDDTQIRQIADSIEAFGFNDPIAVDGENVIIEGHGRLLAAKLIGMSEVPCFQLAHLTPEQKKLYAIAHNRVAENAGWDEDKLAQILGSLQGTDLDLSLSGFDQSEIDDMMARLDTDFDPSLDNFGIGGGSGEDEDFAAAGEDDVAAPEEVAISEIGDLWLLGNHRLHCGDSTNAEHVARLLGSHKPHLMVTDPPYGVEYDPSWREGRDLGVGKRSKGKVLNDDRFDWREAWALFPGDVAYVWHGAKHAVAVADSLTACKFVIRSQIIWAKQHFALSRGDYHWQHEPCWYGVREGGKSHWDPNNRNQSTLWTIKNNNSFGNAEKEETWGHGTQKPVEVMRRPILNNSSPGDYVYEPFCGSGTTLIAAETTGRICLAMELSPHYVDLIVRRWEKLTGQRATLAGDGRTFREIELARLKSA
jgi:DNA modification methylase